MRGKKIISAVTAAVMLASTAAFAAEITTKYPFGTLTRQMEMLDRGLVAIKTDGGIYLSWRLSGDEDTRFGSGTENVTFDIYRDGEKIGTEEKTTNYLDENGTEESEYYVESSKGDKSKTVSAFKSGENYFDIPLERPANSQYGAYTINDCSTGDLDGDGEYEIIVKWDSNGKDNSQSGTTGDVLLDAYKLDGTRVWENPINLGKNIRAGAHYTQFLVYDFDLDGKAEITCKTAPGSKDAKGAYVSDASADEDIKNTNNEADYRNGSGYILEGDEFFTIFEGETGAAVDTIYYPVQRINASVWGDNYGNRVDRFIATVSWLDGEKPYAVYWRGYYYGNPGQRTGICAMSFDGERLSTDYCFDTYDTSKTSNYKGVNGYTEGNEIYVGEGNHNMTTADVDGDGKDEFISGSLCMEVNDENKLMPKWCSFREHGDALHIGAYDPTRDGYVYFSVHEDGGGMSGNGNVSLDYGMTLYDAATGKELLHRGNNSDTGRGMMANVGAGGYFQFWGAGTYIAKGNNEYEATTINGSSSNFRIFWDGDLFDELMEGQDGKPLTVSSWNGSAMSGIFTTDGCRSVNGTKANPSLQADILGDWREEIVMARNDNAALRVFVSDIPTDYKIMTLMHDSVYRSGVAAEQTAYNQPPHIGFYMDETDFSGPVTELKITKQPKRTEYFVGDTLDTSGMEVSVVYENGKEMPVKGYTVDGYDPYAGGDQKLTVTYGGASAELTVTVKTSFQISADGIITGAVPTGENTAILPDSIDGIAVKGFADGSMKASELTNLYIYNNDLTFTGDVFGDDITIHAYEESSAKTYCEENGVKFIVINVNFTYTANENYDEGFESFLNNFIVAQGESVVDSKSINGITYGDNPRGTYPDATTGIKIANEGDNTYLVPVAGEFSTSGRNCWLELDEKTELAGVSEYTFKFDILYPTDCGTLTLTMSDGENTVDSVEITAGMETDTWYTYTYHYDENNNLTRTISKGTNVIEEKDLGPARGKYGISKIDFNRNPDGLNPSTLWGGWGNHGMGACALAYMDNIQAFTPELAAARFIVTDEYNCPIEDALVLMDGTLVRTDKDGIAEIKRENGQYSAEISADGYMPSSVDVTLLEGVQEVPVTLEYAEQEMLEFSINKSEITIPVGYCDLAEYTISPLSLDNGITFASSDPSIASVDADGVITAIAEGETVITASKGDKTAECKVTVINADYDRKPAKIILTGNDTMIADPFGTGEETVTAEVYDANNARIYNVPVDFTCEGADDTEVYDYAIRVKGGKSDIKITAKCGDAQSEKVIKAAETKYTEYASSDFSGSARIVQGKEAQSYAIEGSGITLNAGARGNGGDGYSGFVMANGVLTGQAGQYNSASRNGYITFDDPPQFGGSDEYRFRTKIKFTTDADATVTLSGDGGGILALSQSSGFEKNVEYIYELLYSNGEFIQLVTNIATGEITQTPIYSSVKSLSRIDITSGGSNAAVEFDDMSIMSAEKINSKATICVYDENGDPIEGARVASDSDSAETMANGRAVIRCNAGANTFEIEKDGKKISAIENITTDKQIVNVTIRDARIRLIDSAEPFWYVQGMTDIDYTKAVYDGETLQSVSMEDSKLTPGKGLFSTAGNGEYKVFIWDDMIPLTQAFDSTK